MALDIELYRRTVYLPAQRKEHAPRRISVIDIQPQAATRTMVLIHGYGGSAQQWLYQLRFFGQHMRVIAPDLRGHGLSDDPHGLVYTMDGLVTDLEIILDKLNVQRPFLLVAHSFGGAVATEYALQHPDAISGLALVGVPSRFIVRPILRRLMQIPDPLFSFTAKAVGVALHAPVRTLKPMHDQVMAVWRGNERLPLLRVPTLVVLGQRDTVFLREHYDDVPRSIPHAQSVVISVSAHLVQLERPDAVNRAIRRLLDSTAAQDALASNGKTATSTPSIRPVLSVASPSRYIDMPWLQHYDDNVPEQVPPSQQLLHELLSNAARMFPQRAALVFFGQSIGFEELDLLTNRFAHALHALGIKNGDRVAIVLPNVPQCVIAFYGTLKAGAVVVLGSPLSSEEELRHQLLDCGASILLILTSYRPQIEHICHDTQIKHVLYTDAREYLPIRQRVLLASLIEGSTPHSSSQRRYASSATHSGWMQGSTPHSQQAGETLAVARATAHAPLLAWREHAFQHLLRRQATVSLGCDITSEQLALIQYTSGTTDTPKGVMLSHGNLMANVVQVRHWITDAQHGREVLLCVLPLSHSYGITNAMNVSMCLAGSLVLMPTNRIEQIMQAIKNHRPSILPGVPSLYLAIANYPKVRSYGVASIRICISGSAPLPVEAQEAFEKLTRGYLVEGYGLTEASPVTHSNPMKGERRVGSIGLPLPSTHARIVDVQTGAPLPAGEVGELLIQGPQVMQGYWNMPEETAQVLRDGWLRTGDLARMDEDGFFTIVDRKKDMILAGAYNVYPRDVEEVLYEHPKVLEAAVVNTRAAGSSGSSTSPYIKAVVVLKRGEHATPDELLALCRERLDAYKVPKQIEFRTELPKNLVGKVLRRLLVEA